VDFARVNFERLPAVVDEGAMYHDVFDALTWAAESVSDEAEAPPGHCRKDVAVVADRRVVARHGTALTLGLWHQDLNRGVEVTAATPTGTSNLPVAGREPRI
jgi:hypothetical protein